jgi:DNA processing protein
VRGDRRTETLPDGGSGQASPGPRHLAAATLACLPEMTPARLRSLARRWGDPVRALEAVRRGAGRALLLDGAKPGEMTARSALADSWTDPATVQRIARVLDRRKPIVYVADSAGYPIDAVSEPPYVLLAEGEDERALGLPRVAVVGTRAATPHGLADAREIGGVLAEAGVTVVSGLAIGIDAAAHEGALEADGHVVGVVATGLDVVYPRRHRALFDRVRRSGLLVSESGYGVQPRRSSFPVRNRIIAGLADVVVVVEATLKGGARITADRAIDYGRPVLAVPGSRRNPAAAGTNALIADGAHPLLEPSDILLALGLTPGSRRREHRAAPTGDGAIVLGACGGEPATLDQLASRIPLTVERLMTAIRELERTGWMERSKGLCWPR